MVNMNNKVCFGHWLEFEAQVKKAMAEEKEKKSDGGGEAKEQRTICIDEFKVCRLS